MTSEATPDGRGPFPYVPMIELHRVRLPLLEPFVASHGTTHDREVVLVAATDGFGNRGWGECVALADPTYSAETTATAWVALRDLLVPAMHDGSDPPAGHPMAWAACEAALIDVDLRQRGIAMVDRFGASRRPLDASAVVGLRAGIDETVAAVARRVDEGYRSVKLKIEPGRDLDRLTAVRTAFPELGLAADTNGSYATSDRAALTALAAVDLDYLEQPLAAHDLEGAAVLARHVDYPLALDESVATDADLERAIAAGAGSIVNVKPGRVGGIVAASHLLRRASEAGWGAFVGGMLETGVGRALALVLASDDRCTLPTDLGPSDRYFADDITEPIPLLAGGRVEAPARLGIGVTPRADRLDACTVERIEIPRVTVGEADDDRTSGSATSWQVRHRRGSAAELHGLELPDPPAREVWILEPDRPALVLGSTQQDGIADRDELDRRGIDLVRRRSGGGAVLLDPAGTLAPGRSIWIDVVLPSGDPLWRDDVGRSMDWLGEAWVRALADLGVPGEVHRGPLERTAASTLVCFAGIGPGEVVVHGRKVVGISQRRTHAGARFQCVIHVADGGAATSAGAASIAELLDEPAHRSDRVALVAQLRERTGTVTAAVAVVVDAFVAALPAGT